MNLSSGKLKVLIRKFFTPSRKKHILPTPKYPKKVWHLSPSITKNYDLSTVDSKIISKYIRDKRRY
ncbi:hypothetical protein TpMuguga_01g00226 [Theileria parva strain Muguga]|uniref:uncharacterized protein n=1 Tax=Theileria parva strain Muguga TaxID=333668 RepID=UPI001C6171B1|nr:uncharacterized protein TpMuguga_01g00226 [Theileria parva strain Muguga]EAN33470.2 hypothetical protein TpMuguga_01g00226 [Theileria parva strain Muguga]